MCHVSINAGQNLTGCDAVSVCTLPASLKGGASDDKLCLRYFSSLLAHVFSSVYRIHSKQSNPVCPLWVQTWL